MKTLRKPVPVEQAPDIDCIACRRHDTATTRQHVPGLYTAPLCTDPGDCLSYCRKTGTYCAA